MMVLFLEGVSFIEDIVKRHKEDVSESTAACAGLAEIACSVGFESFISLIETWSNWRYFEGSDLFHGYRRFIRLL